MHYGHILVGGYRESPWVYLPKLVIRQRSEVSTLITSDIKIQATVDTWAVEKPAQVCNDPLTAKKPAARPFARA